MEIIKTKANLDELARLADIKANKSDFEDQMRATDILHRQLTHMAILLLES